MKLQNLIEHIPETSSLLEMANFRKSKIKVEDLDFSFYFGNKDNVHGIHGIRAKIFWTTDKCSNNPDGFMMLHGDYKYVHSKNAQHKCDNIDIETARYFFKRYKVLMAACWENVISPEDLQDFLYGEISLFQVLSQFRLPEMHLAKIISCNTLKEVEQCVITFKMFNLNT